MTMKHATEYICGLRDKLRTMRILLNGSVYVCGDNKSMLYNITAPESCLKKTSNFVAYNFVQEGVTRDE